MTCGPNFLSGADPRGGVDFLDVLLIVILSLFSRSCQRLLGPAARAELCQFVGGAALEIGPEVSVPERHEFTFTGRDAPVARLVLLAGLAGERRIFLVEAFPPIAWHISVA